MATNSELFRFSQEKDRLAGTFLGHLLQSQLKYYETKNGKATSELIQQMDALQREHMEYVDERPKRDEQDNIIFKEGKSEQEYVKIIEGIMSIPVTICFTDHKI